MLTFVAGRQETLWVVDPKPARLPGPEELDLPASEFPPPIPLTPTAGNRLRGLVGAIWADRDTFYFACESDSIPDGSMVSALLVDSAGRATPLRIAKLIHDRTAASLHIFIDGARRPSIYRLVSPHGTKARAGLALGVVHLRHPVRQDRGRWVGDLDGDGRIETVTACSGTVSYKLIVRSPRDRTLLWYAQFSTPSYVGRTCTDEDDVPD
jgi:hypothetical protein